MASGRTRRDALRRVMEGDDSNALTTYLRHVSNYDIDAKVDHFFAEYMLGRAMTWKGQEEKDSNR